MSRQARNPNMYSLYNGDLYFLPSEGFYADQTSVSPLWEDSLLGLWILPDPLLFSGKEIKFYSNSQ